jgi:cephalosporin hydroxylase
MGMVGSIQSVWRGLRPRASRRLRAMIKDARYRRRLGISLADWMIYHQKKIHRKEMRWMGVRILKNPMDCWIYQEILWEVRPDVVVELGSLYGGGTLLFCQLLDLLGHGKVISVDVDRSRYQVSHPRLIDITGDCSDPGVVARVQEQCAGNKVLIVHDADHTKEAVLRDLRTYADLVSLGSYFIVEDGIVDLFAGRSSKQIRWDNSPGPLAAIREFLGQDDRFVVDRERERYLMTANPCGYLRRVKGPST